jgi:hypothetical protein
MGKQWTKIGGSGAAGVPGSGGSTTPPAPNITSATQFLTPGLFGNTACVVSDVIATLPISDPNYAHFARLVVSLQGPDASVESVVVATFTTPFVGSTVTGVTDQIIQDASSHTYTLVFQPYNEAGNPTASPYTLMISVGPSSVVSFASASESTSARTDDPVNPTTKLVYCNPIFVVNLTNNQVPQNVMVWKSLDNGTSYDAVAWYPMTSVGQTLTFSSVAPVAAQTWKIAVCTYSDLIPFVGGVIISAAQMAANIALSGQSAVISSGISIAALVLPTATLVPTLTVATGSGGSWPYNTKQPDGDQFFSILTISYNDSACVGNIDAFFVRVTAQDYAAGVAVGPEQASAIGGFVTTGGVQTFGPLRGDYGTTGVGYVRTAAIDTVRLRRYVLNRADQSSTSFLNPAAGTLQIGGSDPGYTDVVVASGGALPPGQIQGGRLSPSTLTPYLVVNPTTGLLGTTSLDPTNMVQNGDFELGIFYGWSVAFGTAAIVSSPAVGSFACSMSPNGSGFAGVWETLHHPVKPGAVIYAECSLNYTGSAIGNGHAAIVFYDVTNTAISFNFSTAAVLIPGWQEVKLTATAPSNAVFVAFYASIQGEATSGVTWFVDNARMQQQVSTGAGTQPNGTGGVMLNIASPFDIVAQQLALQLASITNAYLGIAAVQAGNMAASSVTAANAAIAANTIVDGQVISVGVPKLLSGTNIFTGDVILSRGTGNPVIDLSNTGMFLYGSATGSSGLTSNPYVSITGSAIGVQASATGHAITITGSAITLWTVNGSASSPYLTLSATDLQISYGAYSLFVSAGEIQLSNGSATLTLLAGTITLSSGSYSTQITASQILMSNGSQFLSLTSSSVLLEYNSGNSIQLTPGTLSITLSGLTSTISGNTITTNQVFAITSISTFQLNLTSGGFISWTGFTSSGSSVVGFVEVVVGGSVFKIQVWS